MIDLERKAEELRKQLKEKRVYALPVNQVDDDDDLEYDEGLDWRSKNN